ncbi:MAG: hypothetical protein K8J08_12205 [Thermoanaerobaculia bacterium]|nr:hypothetical protein [Thermoanaerobaculia bacterium]
MTTIAPSRIILTHWNAGVFQAAVLPRLLPELVIYPLLYEEVLIREEDLLTNRAIVNLLSIDENFTLFTELLSAGLIKLLRLPLTAYPGGRRFDPIRLPVSARAEEHALRRTYKGRPWRPTQAQWRFFDRLDDVIARHPEASRFHAPFPESNTFATQLAELLENREAYSVGAHPVFSRLSPVTADALLRFCNEPEAWQRFLRDSGSRTVLVGPDGRFFRSAAYQCFDFLPTPRAARRLVESVYAATYCDREASDGRYGGSELIELPYRFASQSERDLAEEGLVRIEVAPTEAAAGIAVVPGIARVLLETRASAAFRQLQEVVRHLGEVPDNALPTESTFRSAWQDLCATYSNNLMATLTPLSRRDTAWVRYGVYAYLASRVLGYVILPEVHVVDLPVVEDAAIIAGIEHMGPGLLRSFRGLLGIPRTHRSMLGAAGIRCSRVHLNVRRM